MKYFSPDFDPLLCEDVDELQHNIRALATDLQLRGFGLARSSVSMCRETYAALNVLRAYQEQRRDDALRGPSTWPITLDDVRGRLLVEADFDGEVLNVEVVEDFGGFWARAYLQPAGQLQVSLGATGTSRADALEALIARVKEWT